MSRINLLPVASGRATGAAVGRAALRTPGLLISSVVAAVVASVATIITPVQLGKIVDVVIAGTAGTAPVQPALTELLIGVAAAVLVGAVFTALSLRQA